MSSTIDPGFRAVSVQITDASGVAGLVQPNAHVDVLFTRPGSMAEATTSTILENVKVLSTGKQLPTGATVDPRAPRSPVVTLLLTPGEAQKLELAKNQGKISLSLRNPLDSTRSPRDGPITTEVLDPQHQRADRAGEEGAGRRQVDHGGSEDLAGTHGAEEGRGEERARETPRGSGCLPRRQARAGTL